MNRLFQVRYSFTSNLELECVSDLLHALLLEGLEHHLPEGEGVELEAPGCPHGLLARETFMRRRSHKQGRNMGKGEGGARAPSCILNFGLGHGSKQRRNTFDAEAMHDMYLILSIINTCAPLSKSPSCAPARKDVPSYRLLAFVNKICKAVFAMHNGHAI